MTGIPERLPACDVVGAWGVWLWRLVCALVGGGGVEFGLVCGGGGGGSGRIQLPYVRIVL